MNVFVSSYAAAAPSVPWNRNAEAALFEGFGRMGLAGLELPYYGRLHLHDDAWLVERLRPEWRLIVTLLPGTMSKLKDDPHFGLASADAGGRLRALEFAESARRAIEHLNRHLRRPAVAAVDLHSAPRLGAGAASSLEAFADSLSRLRRRDWFGAKLLVEHCDAALAGRAPDKGFLRLEDECAAISLSDGPTPVQALINWGRSALETRSAAGPREHVRRAREAGLFGGIFFSGVTPEWKDDHAPFSTSNPESLLTPDQAALAEGAPIVGVKIQPLPASLGTDARLKMIADALSALGAA